MKRENEWTLEIKDDKYTCAAKETVKSRSGESQRHYLNGKGFHHSYSKKKWVDR